MKTVQKVKAMVLSTLVYSLDPKIKLCSELCVAEV